MIVASTSTRTAAIAYLLLLAFSLANTAIINRSGDDQSNENNVVDIDDAIAEMSDIIDEGNDPKVVALYDVLKEILVAPAEPNQSTAPIRKRTCYFNAGMSHSCDYNEVLRTVDDVNHWSSDDTPGRRRKRQHSSTRRGRAPTTRSLDGRSTF
ncbi:uncharacterized protein LOC130699321 [Daphnia carinata]|uniref:uncharacterized protein LOC130699321 n=1 Tax=Daphnia carinata TaxID=120202 RepID=UPI00257CB908|nr:uncharacterized protein LOC130699321 [Daphnia carinata]